MVVQRKIIRITTNAEVSIHEYSKEKNDLVKLIGMECQLLQHVRPRGLYQELGQKNACMLVDENGYYHNLEINSVASCIYGSPDIRGNVLIAGEEWREGSLYYCGLESAQIQYIIEALQRWIPEVHLISHEVT